MGTVNGCQDLLNLTDRWRMLGAVECKRRVGQAQPVIGEGRGHRPRERRERSPADVTLAQASPATDSVITLIPLISQIAIVVVRYPGISNCWSAFHCCAFLSLIRQQWELLDCCGIGFQRSDCWLGSHFNSE